MHSARSNQLARDTIGIARLLFSGSSGIFPPTITKSVSPCDSDLLTRGVFASLRPAIAAPPPGQKRGRGR